VRDVHVTLKDVHHPRCHENGQRLAGNVGKPELTELSQLGTIFGIFAVIFVVKSRVSIVEL